MPIKWKSPDRFKPALVLKRIESVRTVNDEGQASYTGLELDECLPTIQSMLQFPAAAAEVDVETLVWRALSQVGKELTPDALLRALNRALDDKLAVRETDYVLLTSLSIDPHGLPRKQKVLHCEIELRPNDYPRKFISREEVLKQHRVSTADTPPNYCRLVAKVRAKSDNSAFHKTMQAVDLLRALLCLMANSRMQFTHGSPSLDPINAIRTGSRHTVHLSDGTSSRDGLWYEPNFTPAKPYKFQKPKVAVENLRWALRLIKSSNYQQPLIASLLRFVRALDQADPNTAFLRLWSALEGLTTPGVADYDKLIRRSAFLFKDHTYHQQVLEHLRSYRNANVHAGEESENARIHCFQLQMYFVNVAWFYIRNSTHFSSLEEAGQFLDLPPDPAELRRRLVFIKRAIKFTSPSDA